ncbi:hypothetical protein [Halalkalibacter sp. APA_J-10(15)]|uniref:hypothetical protein n=1 Tax=Halalkalibacter sp. APA_J-10(15) TaxID=2933805 RepID=UPI001FF6ACF9|nr:hypothetical protein [Halalkalibacter sp. APA_J-10(15)]MCK0473849.1 hypothetical protein [Halalkalibacter sp. APA_J-10(15)]
MNKNIKQIQDLFQQLITILEKENDQGSESVYFLNQVKLGVELIKGYSDSHQDDRDLNELIDKLKEIYAKSNQPRVGLSDYFIWKDDYEERLQANKGLDRIKHDLHHIFEK